MFLTTGKIRDSVDLSKVLTPTQLQAKFPTLNTKTKTMVIPVNTHLADMMEIEKKSIVKPPLTDSLNLLYRQEEPQEK